MVCRIFTLGSYITKVAASKKNQLEKSDCKLVGEIRQRGKIVHFLRAQTLVFRIVADATTSSLARRAAMRAYSMHALTVEFLNACVMHVSSFFSRTHSVRSVIQDFKLVSRMHGFL